ncbi:MAG TPA: MltA domain-containing protein [Candidatus Binatia bacterium]|jgi:membrane-bound lytic murein transglycosylase A|nr:MltA domain-containing protein [Candidatus Binatia bacterium]
MNLIGVAFFVLLACLNGHAAENDGSFFKDDLSKESLRLAIQRSLDFLGKLPPDRIVADQPKSFTAKEIKESLVSFLELLDLWDRPDILSEAVRSRFDFFPPFDQPNEVLFTGYYQPMIDGSLTQSEVFRFPVYGKPRDLVQGELVTLAPERRVEKIVLRLDQDRFVPYFSRYEIDRLGALKGKGYEIAWVKDPVDLFFLHIQGSGVLKLQDGRLIPLSYAASNGRSYKSIGRVLIDSGKISERELSMQRLRRYLMEHPEERDSLLAENESYVFFRFVQGPLGNLEVPLTIGRSMATDPQFFPKGALAFVTAHLPVLDSSGMLVGWQPFSRFVLSQDAGSAIRGAKRADIYFGSGEHAGAAAGYMKSVGRLFLLIKKRADP